MYPNVLGSMDFTIQTSKRRMGRDSKKYDL